MAGRDIEWEMNDGGKTFFWPLPKALLTAWYETCI